MEQKYLIDTNVLIAAQAQTLPAKGLAFLSNIINSDFTISFITYIEFLGFKNVTPATKEFISFANVIETNKSIIDHCIQLRKTKAIKLPDALIAATALAGNLTLITRNTADFKNIAALDIIDPWKL